MNDKINSTINVLTPFKRFCMTIGELPASYLETMTYYEMLLWFTKYLSETVIPTINNNAEAVSELQELFVKLQDYVNTYFDNLDVQEEINNKLDEMALDGSLENIINKVLNATNGTLVCSIDYRDCTEFINEITDESTPIKGYIQGMTTTPTSYIIARQTGGNYHNKTNMIYLEEISKSTKETLKIAYLELFHANSIAYNDEAKEIYVATNSYIDENFEQHPKNDIIVVDYNNFTIKETIIPPSEITDNNRVRSVSYDNKNNVLALADTTDIWIMSDFETVEEHITLNTNYTANFNNVLYNSLTVQNINVYDNKIYVIRYNENGIVIFDINGNVEKNYYNFDIDIDLNIGELESIAIEEDGTLYLASEQIAGTSRLCVIYDTTIFKSNLKYNGFKNFADSSWESGRNTYYVDSNTNNHLQAGTRLYPFKHVEQAILSSQFIRNNVSCNINLMGNNNQYGFIESKNNTNLIINGNNNSIYAIKMQSQNATISNLSINCDTLINVATSNEESNIFFDTSKIILRNITINNSSVLKTNGMCCTYSDIQTNNISINNFTNAINLLSNNYLSIGGITVNNCEYYWKLGINNHIDHGNSPNVISRMNPDSNSTFGLTHWQNIPYTYENNRITLDNIGLDNNAIFGLDLRYNVNNADYIKFIMFKGYQADSLTIITSTDIYYCYTYIAKTSQGIYRVDKKCIKENIATGEKTDVSNDLTYTIRSLVQFY